MDHLDHIRDHYFNPIRKRVLELMEQQDVEFATETMTRLTMEIDQWEVDFDGMFRANSDGGMPMTLRGPNYHKIMIMVRVLIDTIEAGRKELHFIDAIKDHSKYSEAVEGSAWSIFNLAAPILKDGFPDDQKDS
jgi:hypothetical protein